MTQTRSVFGNIAEVLTAFSNAAVTSAKVLDKAAETAYHGINGLNFYSMEFETSAEFDFSKQQHTLALAKKGWESELTTQL